jgi:hypothetical protein
MLSFLKRWFRCSTANPALTRFYLCPHVKLHRINCSDTEFHSHPWNGISLIFGSYVEQAMGEEHRRIGFNYISAQTPHRIIVSKPVWTLFIHGQRINENWTYGGTKAPWRGDDSRRAPK